MSNNIHQLIKVQSILTPGKYLSITKMPIKFEANKEQTTIIGISYRSPLSAGKSLNRILNTIKNNIKFINADKYSNIKDTDNYPTFKDLTFVINELALYRKIYNSEFPNKKKPIKYKNKLLYKHTTIKPPSQFFPTDLTEEIQKPLKTSVDLEFSNVYYDIIKRIEKILNFKLYYSTQYYIFIPENYFIDTVNETENGTAVIFKVPNCFIKGNYFLYKDRYYSLSLGIKTFNENKTEIIFTPKFFKRRIKVCQKCQVSFVPDVRFVYNKQIDSYCCPMCNVELIKYKQPTFNEETIFHPGYHGNRSGFKFIVCKEGFEKSIPIGMELETEFLGEELEVSQSNLLYKLWKSLGKKDIVFERDGSLNDHGVECITNPMTNEYARKYWEPVREILKEYTLGIKSGVPKYTQGETTDYWGIHLTFARKYWKDSSLAKFTNFCYDEDNKVFLQAIAQRKVNYGGQAIGSKKAGYKNSKKQFEISKYSEGQGEKIRDPNRGTTINLSKKGLVEVRMFQSTNDVDEILKNYDFITSMHEWLENYSVGFSPKYTQYLTWLCEPKNIERVKKYKYIIKYLQKENLQIRLKGSIDTIPNTYLIYTQNIILPKSIKTTPQ